MIRDRNRRPGVTGTDVQPTRVLLINSNRFKQPWPVIPFGLCCVASAAEAAGHEIRVLDLCFESRPEARIKRAVAEFSPEVVGVSVRNIDNSAGYNTLFLLDEVRDRVIAPLKETFEGPVIIGGPAVGINGAEMLEFFDLGLAVRGDGERTFVELLRRLSAGEALDGLGGLVRRAHGMVVEDNPPSCVEDLDGLPRPRPWRWLDLKPYARAGAAIQVQTKRGCALGCSYCTYNRIEGRTWRLRSPRAVADEICEAVRESGLELVEFTDSTFNFPLGHCKAVLHELISRKLDVGFRTMGLNPGAVDEELVDLLEAARFREVDLGVESGCDVTLKGLGKSFRKDSVLRAGRLLRERRIPVTWYLLVGGPGETAETLRETFDTLRRAAAPWDLVNVGVGLRVYKGSPIAERLAAGGAPEAEEGFLRPLAYRPAALTLDEVKLLVKREALGRTNWFMYDEDEKTPLAAMIAGTFLLRLLAPRQPIWRLFILMRKAQRLTGVNALKLAALRLKSRRALARLAPAPEPIVRERIGNMLAGTSVLATVALGYFLSPLWLLATAGIALNLMVTSVLNRCVVKSLLTRMGIPGERDIGRREARRKTVPAKPVRYPDGRAHEAHGPGLGDRFAKRPGVTLWPLQSSSAPTSPSPSPPRSGLHNRRS